MAKSTQVNTLVAVYKSHDIRDASDDFGAKFLISHAGKVLADRDSVEAAREYIDQKIAREFARNMKLMGRHENNPDDLI